MHNVTLTCTQAKVVDSALWDVMQMYNDRADQIANDEPKLSAWYRRKAEEVFNVITSPGIECHHSWEEVEKIDSVRHLLTD